MNNKIKVAASMVVVFFSLCSVVNAYEHDKCSAINPYPHRNPDYCLSGNSCWVSKIGSYDETHHCCYFSEYEKNLNCYEYYPNRPPPKRCSPRNPDCNAFNRR